MSPLRIWKRFPYPIPNSLVIHAIYKKGLQHHPRTIPHNRVWKQLDLFGHKACSSVILQFRIADYEALVAKYNNMNYSEIQEFCLHLPDHKKEQLQAFMSEGHLLARMAVQTSLDSAYTAAHSIATAMVIRRASWLHRFGFPKEVQSTVEELPLRVPSYLLNARMSPYIL